MSKYTLKEACRNGAKGAVADAQIYFQPFGFELARVSQPVHFWWGTEDNAVIAVHPETLHKEIVNKTLHYKPGEGHLSLYVNCFKEVLKVINAAANNSAFP